ncbi:E3 ubiquitin-protein ligase CHFR-like isoform X2 [Diadema antillarum]|uniref:E3 ubiquitin-protein ligase CHFR-like isoform X2 n=1 Tax=Diadema antillarum TaxID=105358 RepID=UPI003A871229
MSDPGNWAQLVCISDADGLVIPISKDSFSIGRGRVCDLSMPDNKVISGNHCRLYKQGQNDTVWLEDTSTNGTWLNGVKVGKGQKQRLCHGDEIALVFQKGDKAQDNIVYRFEDIEKLDQTQPLEDSDENTEDYAFDEQHDDKPKGVHQADNEQAETVQEEGARKREIDNEQEAVEESEPSTKKQRLEENVKDSSAASAENKLQPENAQAEKETAEEEKKGEEEGLKGEAEAASKASQGGDNSDGKKDAPKDGDQPKAEGAKAEEEETDDILETLICSICQDILHKCISLQPCMHSFCSACYSGWMKHSKRCPQCRKYVRRIGHNYIVNSLVDAYLKQHPEKQRSKEELAEMDQRDQVPFNQDIDDDDEDEEGDYDPDDEYESDEPSPVAVQPACRQCPHYVSPVIPLNFFAVTALSSAICGTPGPSTSSAGPSGAGAASGSGGSTGQSKIVGGVSVLMPQPPAFQCQPFPSHVNCYCCSELMPLRAEAADLPPMRCGVCRRYFCHLYWGCRKHNCYGCLNKLKEMHFQDQVLHDIINRNTFETQVFIDYMRSQGATSAKEILKKCIDKLDAGSISSPQTRQHNLTGETPMCFMCAWPIFRDLAYEYRVSIPTSDLPAHIAARSNCHWGKNCRTQYNKPHHAANFNHICDQTRF